MLLQMDLESVKTQTKNIGIYIVTQRFKGDSWQCRPGRYGRMVRENVIDIYIRSK